MGTYAKGEFLQEIRKVVPVSFIVTGFQEMRICGGGREFRGFSPFKVKEKTPSFFVIDAKQFYHDFSSGRSGDVLEYLIDSRYLTAREAVAFIIEHTGYRFIPWKFQRKRPKRKRTRSRGI